jgi:FixJ family two-component response regulator
MVETHGMSKALPRIAVVDDDFSVRKAFARLLSANSFEIATYGSAREFVGALKNQSPECLVVDLHMPEISGLDLQTYLWESGIRIPTIIITAYAEPGVKERCEAAGAAAFLLKPVSGATLIAAINAVTKQ